VTLQVVYAQAFGVVVFAIQAPLLSPRAFGLIAIVMVFVTLCEASLESVTEALISIEPVEQAHYTTVNAVAFVAGIAFAAVLEIAANPLATWLEEPSLEPVGRVMAILPLLTGFSAAPSAATKRAVAFRPLAIRMICGVTAGGGVGLLLAAWDKGVWALVAQALVQRGVSTSILWTASPLSFGVRFSRRHWLDICLFARPLALSKSLSWACAQLPRFVLAMHLSVSDLGLFSLAARVSDIATSLTVVPKTAVARVALRPLRADPARLQQATTQLMSGIAVVCFPLCLLGAALLPQLVHGWLRPQWFEAIAPGQILLLSAAASPTFYAATALFLATQHQRTDALVSAFQVVTILFATSISAAHGLLIATLALGIRSWLLVIPIAVLIKRSSGVPYGAFLGSQMSPLTAAVLVGLPVGGIASMAEPRAGAFPTLIGCGVAGLLSYCLIVRIFVRAKVGLRLWRIGSPN
jgi:O-antigen/teichoic acid export membrane protein